jgi:hypothetical protein
VAIAPLVVGRPIVAVVLVVVSLLLFVASISARLARVLRLRRTEISVSTARFIAPAVSVPPLLIPPVVIAVPTVVPIPVIGQEALSPTRRIDEVEAAHLLNLVPKLSNLVRIQPVPICDQLLEVTPGTVIVLVPCRVGMRAAEIGPGRRHLGSRYRGHTGVDDLVGTNLDLGVVRSSVRMVGHHGAHTLGRDLRIGDVERHRQGAGHVSDHGLKRSR